MHIHSVDNKVFIIDEFLPERDFKVVEAFARNLTLPYTQRTVGWSPEIILDSKRVKMGRALPGEPSQHPWRSSNGAVRRGAQSAVAGRQEPRAVRSTSGNAARTFPCTTTTTSTSR